MCLERFYAEDIFFLLSTFENEYLREFPSAAFFKRKFDVVNDDANAFSRASKQISSIQKFSV